MELKPEEVIGSLSNENQKLLNSILKIEKRRLHVDKIKSNSRDEKEIVKEITATIDRAVSDAD